MQISRKKSFRVGCLEKNNISTEPREEDLQEKPFRGGWSRIGGGFQKGTRERHRVLTPYPSLGKKRNSAKVFSPLGIKLA